jgi:hypothetical protein
VTYEQHLLRVEDLCSWGRGMLSAMQLHLMLAFFWLVFVGELWEVGIIVLSNVGGFVVYAAILWRARYHARAMRKHLDRMARGRT